jgi:cold shock CspA family protein
MAKSHQTGGKKDREKRKQKERLEKAEKKKERKATKGKSFEDMVAYVDEFGQFSSTPPERRNAIKAEDIQIGTPKQEDLPPEDLIRKGTVTFFNESKGYGFIKDIETGQSIFVHVSELIEPISEGMKVSYESERGPKGPVAVRVTPIK